MVRPSIFTRFKRKLTPHLPLLTKIGIGLIVAVFLVLVAKIAPIVIKTVIKLNPFHAIVSVFKDPADILETTQNRTNVLILGKGGAGHETPDLTDTIIFVSYSHPQKTTVMISLPRDLWVDSMQAKINTAYYYGNLKRPGGGLILAKAAAKEIINQPIHYVIIVDFTAFKQTIDVLGGIDIDVPETFDDYKYPIPGKENVLPESNRYERVHFDQGLRHFNGEEALKYVRSRNAEGNQGTDFARSQRQQQVILAFQNKLLSTKTLLDTQKLSHLTRLAMQSVETDINSDTVPAWAKLVSQFDRSKLVAGTLNQGDKASGKTGLLINPPPQKYHNQWVLTGSNGKWDEVQAYISSLLQ